MRRSLLAATLLLCLAGCADEVYLPEHRAIPAKAESAKYLGNGWWTFTVEVNGLTRLFIARVTNRSATVQELKWP